MSTVHYRVTGVGAVQLADCKTRCGQRSGVCEHGYDWSVVDDCVGVGWCRMHATTHPQPSAAGAERPRMSPAEAELAIARGNAILAGMAVRQVRALAAEREQRQADAEMHWAVQVATGGLSGLIG